MIDRALLDILACPSCKGDVVEKEDKIVCQQCGLKYPIKDDIPIMLIDQAEK
ncbi:MAG: Trm112 family protein [Candidatus Omnitrophica bacterium]|nr:Trm112 family protein [Candidatus Omnitrophota bacterium]